MSQSDGSAASDGDATPGRRRRRMSDEETRRRMLDAALDRVRADGLTVSLDHISLEDAIRDAGVSRSAVYRRWPYKDLFFADLLRELADATAVIADTEETGAVAVMGRVVAERLEALGTPQGRHDLGIELLRLGAPADFDGLLSSTTWRTYLALHATFLSLGDGRLRDDVQTALARSEERIVRRIADNYARVAALLGYRVRRELDASFATMATLATASFRGLILMALATPGLADAHVAGRPPGGSEDALWSLPGLGMASIATTFLEPDPAVVWDDARVSEVRRALQDERWTG